MIEEERARSRSHAWQKILKEATLDNFAFFEYLYKTNYPDWNKIPCPAWFPETEAVNKTHIMQFAEELRIKDYEALHRYSVEHRALFWEKMQKKLKIIFKKPYQTVLDVKNGIESAEWFSGGELNIADSCFREKDTSRAALLYQTETGIVKKLNYQELDRLSNRFAYAIKSKFNIGAKIAIIMPMTHFSVAIYLGIIKAGGVVVSIADSFSAHEIELRLKIAKAQVIFTQDIIIRDGKTIPLYSRISEAAGERSVIVLPAIEDIEDNALNLAIRAGDLSWRSFLKDSKEDFESVPRNPSDFINILFSSGTTGDPKAIPWTQITPLKCASDAYFHHDIDATDIFCWPTNLGWMMGPWLIFATLLNNAAIALYEGTPNGVGFGKFVQDNQVTILGVVPTIVRTWRHSKCMEGLNWQKIKLFTSTGERSNIEDMLYLMWLAGNRPIIEYCGGTEIGGAYVTGTIVQPAAPAACTTAAMGLEFVILDDEGKETNDGEVAILPPSVGLSSSLLNKDHHEIYYKDMPSLPGIPLLRRHGDHLERFANGYYRIQGRVDDTMKLGGIKVSSAEIEQLLNGVEGVLETAAIAIEPPEGGPSQLVIFVVPKIKNPTEAFTENVYREMQQVVKQQLNPLFKIQKIVIIESLPRTASNKVMRRLLREKFR